MCVSYVVYATCVCYCVNGNLWGGWFVLDVMLVAMCVVRCIMCVLCSSYGLLVGV